VDSVDIIISVFCGIDFFCSALKDHATERTIGEPAKERYFPKFSLFAIFVAISPKNEMSQPL
jgi:hypothetical protein